MTGLLQTSFGSLLVGGQWRILLQIYFQDGVLSVLFSFCPVNIKKWLRMFLVLFLVMYNPIISLWSGGEQLQHGTNDFMVMFLGVM